MKIFNSRMTAFGGFVLTAILLIPMAGLANTTPQTLPFMQNWTSPTFPAANDWSTIPGIVGYQGLDLTTTVNLDARNLLLADPQTAGQLFLATTPTNTSGGIGDMAMETNRVVAMQGSGTADAPHLVIYLNTTGQSNIRVQFNARDIDGTADNAAQQIILQYRVGSAGNYINVNGGYILDATTGPSQATLVIPVDVTLPAAANNQPEVQVRIMSINAPGSDEWVGIDDINITGGGSLARRRAPYDVDGDSRTDYMIVRPDGPPAPLAEFAERGAKAGKDQPADNLGGANFRGWWTLVNNVASSTSRTEHGSTSETIAVQDYDGDGRDDLAVYAATATTPSFKILKSSTSTVTTHPYGLQLDIRLQGDFNNDGKDDLAVYRPSQGIFFWSNETTPTVINYLPWGLPNERALTLDYDGDGRSDIAIVRVISGALQFWIRQSSDGAAVVFNFGLDEDAVITGDFDADGRDDLCLVRNADLGNGNRKYFWILEADGGNTPPNPVDWGLPTDVPTLGDYDGDGRTDIAVWRGAADPTMNFFYVRRSSTGALSVQEWGQQGDQPVANLIRLN
jgi:hypothetical protein